MCTKKIRHPTENYKPAKIPFETKAESVCVSNSITPTTRESVVGTEPAIFTRG